MDHAEAICDLPAGSFDDERFAAAYEAGVERLVADVVAALEAERDRAPRLSAGLRAGLDSLAADPELARLLLVDALAAPGAARLLHERSLDRVAQALMHPHTDLPGGTGISAETAHLLAAGLASHLSGRVLAGEAERLAESHELLLRYLLAPTLPAARDGTGGQRGAPT